MVVSAECKVGLETSNPYFFLFENRLNPLPLPQVKNYSTPSLQVSENNFESPCNARLVTSLYSILFDWWRYETIAAFGFPVVKDLDWTSTRSHRPNGPSLSIKTIECDIDLLWYWLVLWFYKTMKVLWPLDRWTCLGSLWCSLIIIFFIFSHFLQWKNTKLGNEKTKNIIAYWFSHCMNLGLFDCI